MRCSCDGVRRYLTRLDGGAETQRPGTRWLRGVVTVTLSCDYGRRSVQPWKFGLFRSSVTIGKFTSVP